MNMGGAEHVEEILGLWDELIPNCRWAFVIYSVEACDEVILEGLDCSFGCVDAMIVWLYEL
jgi:hypothetical protein